MATEDLLPVFAQLAGDAQTAEIQDELNAIQAWYQALVPGADVRDPIILGLFLLPTAARQAWYRRFIATVRRYALPDVTLIGDIADETLQEAVINAQLELLGVDQQSATTAIGELNLYFTSEPTSSVIVTGTTFTTGIATAVTTTPWTIRSQANSQNDDNELIIRPAGDQFVVTVPVLMLTPGKAGNVPVGTEFTMGQTITGLDRVVAAISFSGGSDGFTGQDLLNAYTDGLISQAMGTRDQIVAFLRQHPELGDIRQVGICGYGDPEMLRDKQSFAPIGGACTDIYLAFGNYPPSRKIELVGTRIQAADAGVSQYTISVDRELVPGFLRILSVDDALSGQPCAIVSIDRGIDTSDIINEAVPQIKEFAHGVFSRFQSATILVTTPANDDAVGATRLFSTLFEYQPGIAIAQRIVSERNARFVGGDTLVRACIPLYLDITIQIDTTIGSTVPDEIVLIDAILDEIYRAPCRAKLYQSDLIRAMSPYLRDSMAVSRIDYAAELVDPSGKSVTLGAFQDLTIPNDPARQLSSRTIAIVTDASRIRFQINELARVDIP